MWDLATAKDLALLEGAAELMERWGGGPGVWVWVGGWGGGVGGSRRSMAVAVQAVAAAATYMYVPCHSVVVICPTAC